MKNSIKKLLFIFVLVVSTDSQAIYNKVIHNIDPEARCLDGSLPAIYLHEADPKNILFYMIGGASCGEDSLSATLESCYQRSKTIYGSSIYWPDTRVGQGIQSTDPTKNIFANWTKVIMLYCDGAFHQGYTKEPFSFKDKKLYFRGGVNTRSHFQYIHNRYNLSNAERVVLSGSSAGGMATFIWAEYLQNFIGNPQVKFYSVIDSGIFLDTNTPLRRFNLKEASNDLQVLFTVSNRDQGVPNRACAQKQSLEHEWQCITIQGALPYLKVESLFLQSAYDQYIIKYGANINCLTDGVSGFSLVTCSEQQIKVIEGYRSYYMEYLKKIVKMGHNIWSIACSWHAVIYLDAFYSSSLQRVSMVTGFTMQEAIKKYVFEGKKILQIDENPWPSNNPCAY